jgi:hypothetical protein
MVEISRHLNSILAVCTPPPGLGVVERSWLRLRPQISPMRKHGKVSYYTKIVLDSGALPS